MFMFMIMFTFMFMFVFVGFESRLRAVCEELLGPPRRSAFVFLPY